MKRLNQKLYFIDHIIYILHREYAKNKRDVAVQYSMGTLSRQIHPTDPFVCVSGFLACLLTREYQRDSRIRCVVLY